MKGYKGKNESTQLDKEIHKIRYSLQLTIKYHTIDNNTHKVAAIAPHLPRITVEECPDARNSVGNSSAV